MVMRNGDGLPYIPGSSIKGRWRFFAERLLYSCNTSDVGLVPVGNLHVHEKGAAFCKNLEEACTICKLFGNPTLPSLLWVGQAELAEPWKTLFQNLLLRNRNPAVHPDAELRPGNALSRVRRTALENHLFFDETVPPVSFTGILRFRKALSGEEENFLCMSSRLVDRIGGRKAIGRGVLENGVVISGGDA
jgi:CRISPR/Cas system CSM-associated protein Csm3 (group 7 of RAMP superfamily)